MPRTNARRIRSRRYCGTLFWRGAGPVLRLRRICETDGDLFRYVIFGRESCPTTGRRHLQFYIELKKAIGISRLKRELGDGFSTAHFEAAKGNSEENRRYCSKEKDFEEYGSVATSSQGRRTDLDEIKRKIEEGASSREIADNYFSQWVVYRRSFEEYRALLQPPAHRPELKVRCLVGVAGAGKTRFIYEYCNELGRPLWISRPSLQWFDGYGGEADVLIDDFRGQCDYEFLLRVLDIYPLRVPIKGGFVAWNPTNIWITSNLEPESWFPSESVAPLRRRIHELLRCSGDFSEDTWPAKKEDFKIKLHL